MIAFQTAPSRHGRDTKYTLKDIIDRLQPGDTLISFNYDTVVESLCHRAGKVLFHRNAPDNNVIRFAKPHGSASWDLMPYNRSRIIDLDGEPNRDPLDRNPLDKDDAKEEHDASKLVSITVGLKGLDVNSREFLANSMVCFRTLPGHFAQIGCFKERNVPLCNARRSH